MSKKSPSKKIRVTVDMSPEFYGRFEELEALVDSPSKAQVIREALQLYEYIAKKHRAGWKFEAISSSGDREHPVFLDLPPAEDPPPTAGA